MLRKVATPVVKAMILLALLVVWIGLAEAGTTGKIAGRVIDKETGDALPMANVLIVGTTLGASSDLNGHYFILQLPPGTYTVKATMMGYQPMTVTNVKVGVDLTTQLNFPLSSTVLDIQGEVTVVAERPIIQKDVTFSSHHVSSERMKNMPVITNIQDVVARQAGVVGEGLHINVRGGRTGEVMYVVDGLSVKDPLYAQATRTTQEQVTQFTSNPVDELSSRSGGFSIPTNAVAEVEVITGGFNAEYGRAMSGIVNVVTKEGGVRPSGRILYLTDDLGQGEFKTPFGDGTGLRKYSQNSDKLELSIGGPEPITTYLLPMLGIHLPVHEVTLFTAANAQFTDVSSAHDVGYYAPTGEDRSDETRYFGRDVGLTLALPNRMDNVLTSISNISVRFSPNLKLMYSYQTDLNWYDEYSHAFRNIPENYWQREERNVKHGLTWNHTLSPKTYYTLTLGHMVNNYLLTPGGMYPNEVYNLWDSLSGRMGDDTGASSRDYDRDGFYDAGYPSRGTYHKRRVTKSTAKLDGTSQVHRHHQLKGGMALSYYEMYKGEIKYPSARYPGRKIDDGPWPELGIFRDFYTRYPTTGALYLQDKIEYETLIVNMGLRWDFWMMGEHVEDEIVSDYKRLFGKKIKQTINPRLGISHPITERDILYFQFGRFTQEVEYRFIFLQDTQSSAAYKLYGNPNIGSEETTQYEVGVKHAFNDELRIELTGFFKDFNGLINTETRGELNQTYQVYVNRDYGSARGLELSLEKRYSHFISGTANYTYSFATGKSSSYRQGYDFGYRGKPIPIREWPLNWDVRHAGNINLDFRVPPGQHPNFLGMRLPDNWGINLMWRYESGRPYTPSGRASSQFITTNSARLPHRAWLHARVNKDFDVLGMRYSLLVEVKNLLNRRNPRGVNTETGEPEGLYRDRDISPATYTPGRNIQFGLALEW